MANAIAKLEAKGEAVTSRALAAAARISLNTACAWLRGRETGVMESQASLSVVQFSSHSVADNIPAAENRAYHKLGDPRSAAVDPPKASPAPPEGEPLLPAQRYVLQALVRIQGQGGAREQVAHSTDAY